MKKNDVRAKAFTMPLKAAISGQGEFPAEVRVIDIWWLLAQ